MYLKHSRSNTVHDYPIYTKKAEVVIKYPGKIVHTNLLSVSNNRFNRSHNHYINAYHAQIMTLVRKKLKCYRFGLKNRLVR